MAILQNGDVWHLCGTATQGAYAGNIFVSAGVSAVPASVPRLQDHVAPARPNPFNPVAKIPYSVASQGNVSIRVFDAAGRLVRTIENTNHSPGAYTAHASNEDGVPGVVLMEVFDVDGAAPLVFGDGQ